MAQTSLLQGKPFYCREWIFHKLQHCLQEKTTCTSSTASKLSLVANSGSNGGSAGKGTAWGLLFVGGPGSGKTALCTELLWPSSPAGLQRGLHRQVLACHFCKAQDSDTLCVGNFIRALVEQICRGGLMPGFEDKLREPSVQKLLQPGECERNPSEAFKSSSSWHQSLKSAEEPPDMQRLTGRNLSFGFIPTNCHKRAFLASDLLQIPMSSRLVRVRQTLLLGSHTLTRAGYARHY